MGLPGQALPGPTRSPAPNCLVLQRFQACSCLRHPRNCRAAQTPFENCRPTEARCTTLEVPHRIQSPPVTMFSRQALLRSARLAAPQRALVGQVRTFAAPAAGENVKPPVALFGLDGTYATALVRGFPLLEPRPPRPPSPTAAQLPLSRPSTGGHCAGRVTSTAPQWPARCKKRKQNTTLTCAILPGLAEQ